ncbi:hypothetical protein E2C01_064821 [Portunus trituberculatus]|uniref:Uncharacterized protein n=1 Tax=Portunus trituberculatus TaxID=210409 RepID=A0A5B7HLD3_PORTR|nr:hypothetical protein [Portunus trituberculatus]
MGSAVQLPPISGAGNLSWYPYYRPISPPKRNFGVTMWNLGIMMTCSGRKDDSQNSTCSAAPTCTSSSDARTDSSGLTGQAQGCTGPRESGPGRGGAPSCARPFLRGPRVEGGGHVQRRAS